MTRDEIDIFVDVISASPTLGEVIKGTGGCRKVRFARPGAGKSSGYRIITFFTGHNLPVFLITVFGKGARANLTKAERNALANITKQIAEEYAKRVVRIAGS